MKKLENKVAVITGGNSGIGERNKIAIGHCIIITIRPGFRFDKFFEKINKAG